METGEVKEEARGKGDGVEVEVGVGGRGGGWLVGCFAMHMHECKGCPCRADVVQMYAALAGWKARPAHERSLSLSVSVSVPSSLSLSGLSDLLEPNLHLLSFW